MASCLRSLWRCKTAWLSMLEERRRHVLQQLAYLSTARRGYNALTSVRPPRRRSRLRPALVARSATDPPHLPRSTLQLTLPRSWVWKLLRRPGGGRHRQRRWRPRRPRGRRGCHPWAAPLLQPAAACSTVWAAAVAWLSACPPRVTFCRWLAPQRCGGRERRGRDRVGTPLLCCYVTQLSFSACSGCQHRAYLC